MQRNIETTLPDTISVVRTTKISDSSKVHDAKTSRKATTPISHQTLTIKVQCSIRIIRAGDAVHHTDPSQRSARVATALTRICFS